MNNQALRGMNGKKLKAAITPDIVAIGKAVFMAMAYFETVKPIVIEYQTRILKELQAPIALKWIEKGMETRIIETSNESYLMEDAAFDVYIDRCQIEIEKAGFKVPERGYCPLLIAQSLVREAKGALIDVMEPITGIAHSDLFNNGFEDYDKYIDLTLRMLANKIK